MKKLLAFLICISVLASCKKYEDGPSFTLLTKKMRLTGEWELRDVSYSTSTPEVLWTFAGDGSYRGEYASSFIEHGIWAFDKGKEHLKLEINFNLYVVKITRLSNKELHITDTDGDRFEFEKI